ncbi:MAG: rhombosortase, partial [Gammaproteobacteria bacterium]|nr:rhombosortase [Gammaproteobacteria bacterium]
MGLHKLDDTSSQLSKWWLPLALIAIALAAALAGELGRDWLRYDRIWIAQGEGWRFLSAHIVHLGWSHLLLNALGLLLVWYLVGANLSSRRWLSIMLIVILCIDAGLWWLNPGLLWYVGLSGLLHGMLVAGLAASLPRLSAENAVLGLLLLLKLGWEQFGGPLPGSEVSSGGPVVVDAHLYGAVGGAVGAFLTIIRVQPR